MKTDSEGRVIIRRLDGPIKLDGLSDEPAWKNIEPLHHIRHSPSFGDEPSEWTIALIGFDDDYLYLAGRLYDSEPSKIYRYSKDRDTQNPSNDFFGFFTTPTGLRWDAHVYNDERMPFRLCLAHLAPVGIGGYISSLF